MIIRRPLQSGEVLNFAAAELASSLAAILGEGVGIEPDRSLGECQLWLGEGVRSGPHQSTEPSRMFAPGDDGFAIWREPVASPGRILPRGGFVLAGGSERAVLHAAFELLRRAGVRVPVAGARAISRGSAALDAVERCTVTPAFTRRAIASDIMTWHYDTAPRLAAHLEYDRAFTTWMAARGLNGLSYIRHVVDSPLKIEALAPVLRERGIASEYGGHVLPLLLERERFSTNPDYFALNGEGARNPRGNLCVSNPAALKIVCEAARRWVRDNPECALLHIWGADVAKGAWCRCAQCMTRSPQRQYMEVVNEIAHALGGDGPPVAYLAYHDTLEPDPALKPHRNVWLEWAPRERCYTHAIDDPACEINPRYLESLKRCIDLFDGRAHVFEYYADAILFGGLACATPAVIVRDLRAYQRLGLSGVSCLTFGMHSALAYPVNLETFARAATASDFEPERGFADVVRESHPGCAPEMMDSYRAIARASALILTGGGEVMRPRVNPPVPETRLAQLKSARSELDQAIAAFERIIDGARDAIGARERDIWNYSREVVSGIADYIEAAADSGAERIRRGDLAIKAIGAALERLQAAAPAARDTWANWDLEWIREVWLDGLRRRFEET